jgi:hypothetical protein
MALFMVVMLMLALSTSHYFLHYFSYEIQFPYLNVDDLPPDMTAKFYRIWCALTLIERTCVRICHSRLLVPEHHGLTFL